MDPSITIKHTASSGFVNPNDVDGDTEMASLSTTSNELRANRTSSKDDTCHIPGRGIVSDAYHAVDDFVDKIDDFVDKGEHNIA